MPELPEVETIKQDLKKKILNKKIKKIVVKQSKLVKNSKTEFINTLENNHIEEVSRIGKLMIFHLADGQFLLVHLKLTGQLIYLLNNNVTAGGHDWPQVGRLPNKYSHIIFDFVDNSQLFFNDLRQFGYMHIVDAQTKERIVDGFGIEPLQDNFTWQNFQSLFDKRKIPIKPLLLDQKIIAGIGNIYADEICWRAKILPERPVNTLTITEKKRLFQACQYIIAKAIARKGTTFRNYVDSRGRKGNFSNYLKVYGRGNQICLGCQQTKIKKTKLRGRGTSFCPQCQK